MSEPGDEPARGGRSTPELAAELPGLRLRWTLVDAGGGRTPRGAARGGSSDVSTRFRGATRSRCARGRCRAPTASFFRQVGLDPDVDRTPVEQAAVERLVRGELHTGDRVADALIARGARDRRAGRARSTRRALDGDVALRAGAGGGDAAGSGDYAHDVPAGRLVLADARGPVAVLFGRAVGPPRAPAASTRAVRLVAIQVPGVPDAARRRGAVAGSRASGGARLDARRRGARRGPDRSAEPRCTCRRAGSRASASTSAPPAARCARRSRASSASSATTVARRVPARPRARRRAGAPSRPAPARPRRARARPRRPRRARCARARVVVAQRAELEAASRALLEEMLREPRRHKCVRLRAADLGERGCGVYQVRPRLGLIGMLVGWWHVKLSSGCPLATPAWAGPARGASARSCLGSVVDGTTQPQARDRDRVAPPPARERVRAPRRRRRPADARTYKSRREDAPQPRVGAVPADRAGILLAIVLLGVGFFAHGDRARRPARRRLRARHAGGRRAGRCASTSPATARTPRCWPGSARCVAAIPVWLLPVPQELVLLAGAPGVRRSALVGFRRAFMRRSGGVGFRA